MPQRELAFTRGIFLASLLCTTALLIVLVFFAVYHAERYIPLVVGSILVTSAGWVLIPWLHRRGVPIGIFLALAAANFFLIVPELALRAGGFRYESGIQFGYPRPSVFLSYVPDEKLFWKLDSSRPEVNSMGFPGREPETPKPPGDVRILFLGDSCTQQGYPRIVELFLRSAHPADPPRFECTSLAVSGYSSYQGRVLAEMYGEKLDPDLVVVYFGWNDHWLAYGEVDAEKVVAAPKSGGRGPLQYLYRRSRLVQGLIWIAKSVRGVKSAPLDVVRVPPDDYRGNLQRICTVFNDLGIPVILVTAPTSHYRLGVPEYLVDANYARGKESAIALHRQYNDIVREMGSGSAVSVVDLERALDGESTEDIQAMFTLDGIHLTQDGMAVVARFLTEAIEAKLDDRALRAGSAEP